MDSEQPNITRLIPSKKLSYVIGVHYGDGNISHFSRNYAIRLTVKDLDFLKEWGKCGYTLLKKKGIPAIIKAKRLNTIYYSTIYSKSLYTLLSGSFETHKSIVDKYPEEFIRGFFDSEGCVRHLMHKGLKISANNTDMELLSYVKKKLEDIGIIRIGWYVTEPNAIQHIFKRQIETKKKIYEISFSNNKSIKLFSEKIGFTIQRKNNRLKEYVKKFEKICELCHGDFIAKVQYQKHCSVCSSIICSSKLRHTKKQMNILKNMFQNYQNGISIIPQKKSLNQFPLINRITIDIDNSLNTDYAEKVIKQFGFKKNISIKTSPSKKGRHIIGWTSEGGYPLYQLLFIRHLAFDDATRIILDSMANRQIQVLFTSKIKQKVQHDG